MTYDDLAVALKRTGIPFKEGSWMNAEQLKSDHGVYAIDGRDDLISDDHHSERLLEGTVDIFTWHSNGQREAAIVEEAMDSAGILWRVGLAGDYEENTGYTHWEWIFQCLP